MPEIGGDAVIPNAVISALRPRWLVLHYHIFKNAGSTLEYVLNRAFGKQFTTLHGPDADSILTGEDLLAFIDERPDLVAISSHHLKYPRPSRRDLILFDLCFLRDPLQRLWSMYRYMRRVAPFDDVGAMANTLDARSFMEWLIQDHPHLINDVQVNTLARGGVYTRPPSEVDLAVARDVLREMTVPGVVDIFDESLIAAEYFLRPAFPTLQFQYVKQNVTPTDGDTGSRPNLQAELGDTLYRQLSNLNRLDLELLSCAKREVLRRYEMIPRVEERRRDFERRCEHLQSVHEGFRPGAPSDHILAAE